MFRTCLCVDGSVRDPRKRPMYCVTVENGRPRVRRCPTNADVLGIRKGEFERPILVTADVPIGLPSGFQEVYGCRTFIRWLENRMNRQGWTDLVTDSVASQSPQRPFVVCKRGESKYDGRFPRRVCEEKTNGESLYWCVGGKQVGKAALHFWHRTLLPLREHLGDDLAIWPFESIEEKNVVIAECYPAILYNRVWGRRVTKTNPYDVVDAVYEEKRNLADYCDDKTWLHGVSSDDEFDMLTTALAIARWNCQPCHFLTAPDEDLIRTVEGWMLGLQQRD